MVARYSDIVVKEALKKSIAHWKRLNACNTLEEINEEGYGVDECALCRLFFYHKCNGCPVSCEVDSEACRKTPYEKAVDLINCMEEKEANVPFPDPHVPRHWEIMDEWKEVSEEEIKFLQSLLKDFD
jgi:hypothetical protein